MKPDLTHNLCEAAGRGDIEAVRRLVEEGANVNAVCEDGKTPLHYAVEGGHLDVVKYLIELGADAQAKDNEGRTPCDLATSREIRALLGCRGFGVSGKVKGLFVAGVVILIAAVVYIFASGKGTDKVSSTAKANEVMQEVKQEGGMSTEEVNKGENDLCEAVRSGDYATVKRLIEGGEDIDAVCGEDGKTLLHLAAAGGHLQVVKYLVEKGADVNAKDDYEQTPLHWAASKGHLSVVKFLVERGANVNTKDLWYRTPLHEAVAGGHLQVVKYLVERGANVNAKDEHGNTPLHEAAEKGNLLMVKYLVEHGANVNVNAMGGDRGSGYTPLHLAALEGHLQVVKYLVEKGANVSAKNNHGQTPCDLTNNEEIKKALNYCR